MDRDKSVVGNFQRRDYPLTITIEGEGTFQERIVSSPKTTDYPFETVVELTPIPSDGWRFSEWGGEVSGNENPIQITIDGDKNVTVKFSPIVFLGENGITIMCPDGEVGEIGVVNGVEYEVVNNNLLVQRLEEGRGSFNRNVCVSHVTNMNFLFDGMNFNQSIGDWDVSNVRQMGLMFRNTNFNQPIGEWNVSKVTGMYGMFSGSKFNQPIGKWKVSNVTTMSIMFSRSPFNQSISSWDVSNVKTMDVMFSQSPFNQNISNWCVWRIGTEPSLFSSESPLIEQNKPVWGTCPD